ncbi:N-acetylglucosaminyl-phosphatidylinositol de-N-acetylase isoform X2 [Nelusetta ayraudi]|uniref:N-acetylglucosaminyl-phosphatidylinositol de-N-acetylase isoform X2 n=1 Tax=Nelusetta ayraudi TaxID=303726 RepID=UPI003F6F3171
MSTVKIMCVSLGALIFFVGLVCIKCLYNLKRATFGKTLSLLINSASSQDKKSIDIRALIVTAHPDDECMFFAPTIIRLIELNASVHLLCLSEGDYYSQGAERKQELLQSCALLGIPNSRITIVDHKNLPDDPKAEWKVSLVSSLIAKHIRAHSFNMVLTFDGSGVSGHANHIAIYKAVSHLASSGQVPNDCCLLSLVTVGLFRKYISFLELPLSCLLPTRLCCCVGLQGYRMPCFAIALNSCGSVTSTSSSHGTCS